MVVLGAIGCVKAQPGIDEVEPPPVVQTATPIDDTEHEAPEPAPTMTAADPCQTEEGLVLSVPAAIESSWNGATVTAGSGPLRVWWCGEGTVVLRTVDVMELDADGKPSGMSTHYEFAPEHGTLGSGESLTHTIRGAAGGQTMGVHAIAVDEAGREHPARATVESVDDPERTAQREACLAAGGTWAARGLMGAESCSRPTADAGRRCLSDGDCEGACLHEGDEAIEGPLPHGVAMPRCSAGQQPRLLVGKCDASTRRFGCHPRLRTTVVECLTPGVARRKRTLCVD